MDTSYFFRRIILPLINVWTIAWCCIQPLIFPARAYKTRYRTPIIICILICPIFLTDLITRFTREEETWTPFLLLAALIATILYFLRHRKPIYTKAPGLAQIKDIGIKFALFGWIVFGIFLIDEAFLRTRVLRPIVQDDLYRNMLLAPWGISHIIAAVGHYAEAIIHRKRDSDDAWQEQLDKIGNSVE
ncbi:MAG: hypothetical protein AB8F95_16225 [Bacteroidia bacterium]